MKVCPRCGERKPLSDYWTRKNGKPTGHCKPCASADLKEWRGKNPEYGKNRYKREKHLLRTYGLDLEKYQALMAGQQDQCAICRADHNPEKLFCVDHCHGCGAVRGLLCKRCNTLLGQAKDDPGHLSEAIAYLRRGCGCVT